MNEEVKQTLKTAIMKEGGIYVACTIEIFCSDDVERMLEKYNLSAKSIATDAIQEAIHIAAVTSEPWMRDAR